MKLEEILKQNDKGEVKEALAGLMTSIEKQEKEKLDAFHEVLANIVISQKALTEAMGGMKMVLQQILERPHPEFPEPKEFPEVQTVHMEKPDWYVEPKEADTRWIPNLSNSIRYDGEKTREVLKAILDKLNEEKEEEVEEIKEAPKTVNTGALRTRKTVQWRIATYPQVTGTVGMTAKGDGLTYYLPSAVIKNSEMVRLNGAAPLSYGEDYSISGNAVIFVQDQTESKIEVKYQTK